VPIIRRSNCINTASCIVFSVSGRPEFLNLHTGRSLTENTIQDAVLIQFDLLMMRTELHETCRGLYNVIVHQVGHLPRLMTLCCQIPGLNLSTFYFFFSYMFNVTLGLSG